MIRSRSILLTTLSAALVLGLCSPAARAYVRLMTDPSIDTTVVPTSRPDAAGIQFYMSSALVAGLQSSASGTNVTVLVSGSDPVGAARAAEATWNAAGASVHFLPLQSTCALAGGCTVGHAVDGNNVIVLATSAADISALGSAVAITASAYVIGPGQDPYNSSLTVTNGSIVDSDILINPANTFSTNGTGSALGAELINGSNTVDFQAVMTHEFGHSLGASHTGVLGATMFQYAALDERFPSTDDLAFVRAVYPPSGGNSLATIQGTITTSTGSPVAYGLLTMIDTSQQITVGGLTAGDGTYSIQVPAGAYTIYAEPFNSVVQPANLYLTAAEQAAATLNFQSTLYGGAASPTVTTVAAGKTATVSFSVTSGTTTLAFPYIGFGAAGGNGDVLSFTQGPQLVPSGPTQSIDIALTGAGYDSTMTTSDIQIFGGGITVKAGSFHVDSKVTVGGLPVVRVTLNIATGTNTTLASIFLTKGGNTLSLSGILAVTPPTPQFTSASVVNAASYLGISGSGAASPGGIYAIFATTGTSFLGPGVPVVNGGFDAYGHLPTTLAGVTVTFDGVAAPLFFVYGGQINLQVPFEVAGKTSTSVVVSYYNGVSAAVSVPVYPVQPGFFTYTPGGADSITTNQDYSFNSATDPAPQGSYITIYGTGLGASTLGAAAYGSGLQTGVGAPGVPAGYTGNVTCAFNGGTPVNAYFAGWTPGTVGLAQFTVQVPTGVTGKASVVCTDVATGRSTQTGTIYAQ